MPLDPATQSADVPGGNMDAAALGIFCDNRSGVNVS